MWDSFKGYSEDFSLLMNHFFVMTLTLLKMQQKIGLLIYFADQCLGTILMKIPANQLLSKVSKITLEQRPVADFQIVFAGWDRAKIDMRRLLSILTVAVSNCGTLQLMCLEESTKTLNICDLIEIFFFQSLFISHSLT